MRKTIPEERSCGLDVKFTNGDNAEILSILSHVNKQQLKCSFASWPSNIFELTLSYTKNFDSEVVSGGTNAIAILALKSKVLEGKPITARSCQHIFASSAEAELDKDVVQPCVEWGGKVPLQFLGNTVADWYGNKYNIDLALVEILSSMEVATDYNNYTANM